MLSANARGVLVVPRVAVRYDNGQHYVFVFDGEKVHRRDIAVGVASSDKYEVVSGLSLGDRIARARGHRCKRWHGNPTCGGQMNVRSPYRPARVMKFSLAFVALVIVVAVSVMPSVCPVFAAGFPPDASAAIQTAQHQFNSGNYTAAIKTLQAAGITESQ